MRIAIHWFGDVPFIVLKELAMDLRIFNVATEIGKVLPVPPEAYNKEKDQFIADVLLALASAQDGDKVLCVASFDIYTKPLNFVFGEAEVGGRGAVISIARLGDENNRLFRERVAKEAIHELGHTLGLNHCPDTACVMHYSTELADTDFKKGIYCANCSSKIPISWRPKQMSPGSC